MKKYWVDNICKVGVALLCALSFIGCTKTDDTTGNDSFIPGGEDYRVYQDVISSGFTIKTIKIDSVAMDGYATPLLGSEITKREGQINYSIATQFYPLSTDMMTDNNAPFGINHKVDSAYFVLNYVPSKEVTEGQRFTVYVYEMIKGFPSMDSTYFSNFPIEQYIGDEPMLTIDAKVGEPIYKKIPNEYAEKIMSLRGEEYKSISEFHERFKGFYIKTSLTQGNNVISYIVLANSGIDIRYHNKNKKPDTTVFAVNFAGTGYDPYYGIPYTVNKSVNIISRNYDFKDPIFGVDFENNKVSDISYVSGMAGLMTELEIPQTIIDEIKAKVASKGGKKIMVLNATLVIPSGDTSLEGLSGSIPMLGVYKQYQPIFAVNEKIPHDYPYILEDYSAIFGTLIKDQLNRLGGELNRATGEYRMNISSTIQGLINGVTETNKIQIAPGYKYKESVNVSVLSNKSTSPIKLELTYSVVK